MDPQEPTANVQPTPASPLLIKRRPSSWDLSPPQYCIPSAPLHRSGPSSLVYTMPPTRTANQSSSEDDIPRPQNAFMLYRAQTAKLLRGQGVQSEISKKVGQMWRALTPVERQHWDYLADVEKMQHTARYPHYRFNPKSKAQRAADKAYKKQMKQEERIANGGRPSRRRPPAQNLTQPPPPVMGAPPSFPYSYPATLPVYAPDAARYGTAGPSPPLSAAASPYASSSDEDHSSSSNYASSSKLSVQNDTAVEPPAVALSVLFSSGVPPATLATAASAMPHLANQWETEQHLQYNAASSSSMTEATGFGTSNASQEDFLSFNMPQLPTSTEFDLALQAILASTNDPNIFEVNAEYNWPHADNLEVGMGQQPMAFSFESNFDAGFMTNFNNFNFHNLSAPSGSTDAGAGPLQATYSGFEDYPELTDNTAPNPGDFNFSQFLNYDDSHFDNAESSIPDTRSVSPTDTNTAAAPQSAPYMPPAGAQKSSTRRVGGSWHRSFAAAESPIEVNSPQGYPVRAT